MSYSPSSFLLKFVIYADYLKSSIHSIKGDQKLLSRIYSLFFDSAYSGFFMHVSMCEFTYREITNGIKLTKL